jgi:hypothetical protein
VQTTLVTGTLLLLAVAAFTANSPGEPQASATKTSGTASPDAAKQSSTASAGHSASGASKRKIPCKTPDNAAMCYWTHGRLSNYSVNFTWLLWKISANRLLKICDEPTYSSMQSTGDCADPEFPANLERVYDADQRHWKMGGGHGEYFPPDVFGDFQICPLEPERKGERQYACIESAKITFVQK